MIEDSREQTCQRFQMRMAELIALGDPIEDDRHVKGCATRRQLLHDMQTIAEDSRHLR